MGTQSDYLDSSLPSRSGNKGGSKGSSSSFTKNGTVQAPNAEGFGFGDVLQGFTDLMDVPIGIAANGLDALYDFTIGDLTNTKDAFTGEDIKWIPELASWFIPGAGALRGVKALGRGMNALRTGARANKALKGVNEADKLTDAARLLQTGNGTAEELAAAKDLMNQASFTSRVPLYQFTDEAGNIAFSPYKSKALGNIPQEKRSVLDAIFNRGDYNPAQLPSGTAIVKGADNIYYAVPDAAAAVENRGFLNALRGLAGGGKAPKAEVPKAAAAQKGTQAATANAASQAASPTAQAGVNVPAGYQKVATPAAQAAAPQAAKASKAASAASSQAPEGYVNVTNQAQQAEQLARDFGISPIMPRRAFGESVDYISRGMPMSRRFLPTMGRGGLAGEVEQEMLEKLWRNPKNYRLLRGRQTK